MRLTLLSPLLNRTRLIFLAAILIGLVAALALPATSMAQDGSKADDYPTLGPLLTQIAEAQRDPVAAAATGQPLPPRIDLSVYTDTPRRTAEIVAFLDDNGAAVRATYLGDSSEVFDGVVRANIPADLLTSLAVQPGVEYVREIVPGRPVQSSGNPPTVWFPNGAADVMGATAWHNEGYTGEGVRVGIIDRGFLGFTERILPQLQAPARFYCESGNDEPTNDLADCEKGGYHGTDVTDYLLGLAPDVSLYISDVYVTEAVEWMIDNDVQVINHSLGYPWEGPGDGTTPYLDGALRAVDRAVAGGITFVSGAGNSNGEDWFGSDPEFKDLTVGQGTVSYVDFDLSETNQAQSQCLDVRLRGNTGYLFQLRWSGSWPGTDTDLDFYLFGGQSAGDPAEASASSTKRQDPHGEGSKDFPHERFSFASPVSGTYCLAVLGHSGSVPHWVQVSVFNAPIDCFGAWDDVDGCDWRFLGSRSILNPAESANPGMLAPGAMGYTQYSGEDPYRGMESFSSRGPTTDLRIKPDITGIDRLARDGGYDGPRGTSFSGPSVSGLAALVIDRYGNDSNFDTPAEVAAYLKEQAEDLTASDRDLFSGYLAELADGPDNVSGFGLAMLPDPNPANPPIATLHLSSAELFESASGSVKVAAHLDKPAASDLTITLSAGSSTAYSLSGTSLTIKEGDLHSSGYVTLSASDNQAAGGHLAGSVSGTVSGAAGIADPDPVAFTVIDDESAPRARLILNKAATSEGVQLDGPVTVTLTLDHPASLTDATIFTVSVPASDHYNLSPNATLTVAAGATSSAGKVTITPKNNSAYSGGSLSVTVSATTASAGVVNPEPVTLTIFDDEPLPTVNLFLVGADANGAFPENANPVPSVAAELSGPASEALTIQVSAPSSDHYNLSQNTTLTIAAGATTSTGTVTIIPVNNSADDADRLFQLSGAASGGNGVEDPPPLPVAILDDEGSPTVRLALTEDSILERRVTVVGSSAEVYALLSEAVSADVTVQISASAVPPAEADDFVVGTPSTLTIPAGSLSSLACELANPPCTGSVSITGKADYTYNPTPPKQVTVSGTVTGTGVADPDHAVTLTIDDADFPQVVSLLLSKTVITEGESAEITPYLRWYHTADVTVTIQPSQGVYTVAGSGAATIPAGGYLASAPVTITAVNDGQPGGDQIVAVIATASSVAGGVSDPAPETLVIQAAPAELPGTPAAPTLTTATSTSLTVSWTAPANTGPDITDYDARYCPTGGSCDDATGADWTVFQPDTADDSTETSATITGLTPSTEYYVQVRAENTTGVGAWSPSLTAFTTANSPPVIRYGGSDAGASVRVQANENTSPSFAFTAQDSDSGQTMTWSLTGDTGAFELNAGVGDAVIVSLKSSASLNYEVKSTYSLTLSVSDGAGGSDSVAITVTVLDVAEPPGKPAAPTVSAASPTSIKASWTAPDNTGPAITGYNVRYRATGATDWIAWSHAGVELSTTITGLDKETEYEAQVQAINDEGVSAWSNSGVANTSTVITVTLSGPEWVHDGRAATYTVRLSGLLPSAPLTVDYATADGTATTADGDYTEAAGTLTFPAGSADPLTVTVNTAASEEYENSSVLPPDKASEGDEDFTFSISNVAGGGQTTALGNASVTTSILDPYPRQFFDLMARWDRRTVGRGNPVEGFAEPVGIEVTALTWRLPEEEVTLVLNFDQPAPTPEELGVSRDDPEAMKLYDRNYGAMATPANGDNAAEADFEVVGGPYTLTFRPDGDTYAQTTAYIRLLDDNVIETRSEKLFISAAVQGMEPGDIRQPYSIDLAFSDDANVDVKSGFIVNGAEVDHYLNAPEGETIEMFVKLPNPLEYEAAWSLIWMDNNQYDMDLPREKRTRFVFPAGSPAGARQSVAFTAVDDDHVEWPEAIMYGLRSPRLGVLPHAHTPVMVIIDNDTPSVSVSGPVEVNGGTAAEYTISLSRDDAPYAVQVDYATGDGTATTGDGDYTATSGTLTIRSSGTVQVPTAAPEAGEGSEDFTFTISNAMSLCQSDCNHGSPRGGVDLREPFSLAIDAATVGTTITKPSDQSRVDGIPEAPAAPTITSASSSSLIVGWTAPDTTGQPDTTGYGVRYREGTTGSWTEHSPAGAWTTTHDPTGAGLSTMITGLTASTSYQVQVRASDAQGVSPWSDSGTGSTSASVARSIIVDPYLIAVDEDTSGYFYSHDYKVRLSVQPSANVTITLTSEDASVATVSPGTMTFTAGNWNSAQTATVTAADDQVSNPGRSTRIKHSASGGGYDQIVAYADVALNDDDGKYIISASYITIAEEGTAMLLSLKLSEAPTGATTVTITSADPTFVTATLNGSDTFTFDSANWDTIQPIHVQTYDDDIDIEAEFHSIAINFTASGGGYDGVRYVMMVYVKDNDTKGINVSPASLSMNSGSSDTYEVELNTEPTAPVTFSVSSDDSAKAAVAPESLTFTADDWDRPKTVTVSAPSGAASGAASISNAAAGGGYTGLSEAVSVTVTATANNAPVITNAPATPPSVAENSDSGVSLHTFEATDADGDTVTWSLKGAYAGLFSIDSSGQMTTAARMDFEHYEGTGYFPTFTVQATDSSGSTDTATVSVTVTDVNEPPEPPNAPWVLGTSASSLLVNWDGPVNTGPDITDYDVRYRAGTSGAWITTHDHTGTGRNTTITGLTAYTSYQVQVLAKNDEGDSPWSASGTGSTNPAPTPTNPAPVIGGPDPAVRSVAENSAQGANVGAAFTATDADGDTLTWSLEGTDGSSFRVGSSSGQVTTHAALDHETKDEYSVTVKVDDGNGGTDTVTLTISVTDAAEPPPAPAAPAVFGTTTPNLAVGWTAPDVTGRPAITDYDVRYCEDSTGCDDPTEWTDAVEPGANTGLTITTGLKVNTSYQVQVRAENAEGESDWSASGTGITNVPMPLLAHLVRNRFIAGVADVGSSDELHQKAQAIAARHDAILLKVMRFGNFIILQTNFTTQEEHDQFLVALIADPDVRFAEQELVIKGVGILD